eukprot:CAMPEP_0113296072 /NCGR_PEP_ID=MMETSP0008_2-20120614/36802_1 /TAXON_ID=97485 /ORGANISM="Prymnesium parvum" /LENGTH=157 /DNA_ID=CAMNT_0000148857 /DNA_START=318 /DNA_END=792 /DNA_ORIENTATION=+ /assembly_acc=CAM_ASM_000153
MHLLRSHCAVTHQALTGVDDIRVVEPRTSQRILDATEQLVDGALLLPPFGLPKRGEQQRKASPPVKYPDTSRLGERKGLPPRGLPFHAGQESSPLTRRRDERATLWPHARTVCRLTKSADEVNGMSSRLTQPENPGSNTTSSASTMTQSQESYLWAW